MRDTTSAFAMGLRAGKERAQKKFEEDATIPWLLKLLIKKIMAKAKPASKAKAKAHPGFKAVAAKVAAKEGVSPKAAAAIVAKSSRGASAAAKKANPKLAKVVGKKKVGK